MALEQAKRRRNAHVMMVDGMCTLMSQKVKRCQSSDFYALGLKWNFEICSNVKKDTLSFYLAMVPEKQYIGSNWEVNCSFVLSVVSLTGAAMSIPTSDWFRPTTQSWGRDVFISFVQLKEKYIWDDKAIFCAEIMSVKPNIPVTNMSQTMSTAERTKLMEVPPNNSKFHWKIIKFSAFICKTHASHEFTAGPRRWKLEMYPKGDNLGVGHYFSLFLTATSDVTNNLKGTTLAVYKLRIVDQLNCNHYESSYVEALFPNDMADPRTKSWGVSKFLPLEELHNASRGLLVNDAIYIGVQFFYFSTSENF